MTLRPLALAGRCGHYDRSMPGALHRFLSLDHDRLDALLSAIVRSDGSIDLKSYGEFRAGLLRHISIEERVLFPELRQRGADTALQEQLHRDHAALAALLVPPPASAEIAQIAAILRIHNELEETSGGLYELIEKLSGNELTAIMVRVHAIPEVRLAPHSDTPILRRSIEQLLREADEGRKALLR
jgi:hypothetical protein